MTDINNSFHIEVLDKWLLSKNDLTAWEELLTQQPNGSFFLSYEWLYLWWNTFAQAKDILKLILVYDADKLVAIFPFYLKKGETLYFIGTGEDEQSEVCSEYLDIILANDYQNALLDTFNNILQNDFKQIKQMMFSNVLFDSYIVQCIERAKKHYILVKNIVGVRYKLSLPSDYLTYEATRSRSFISQANRKKRKFEKLGGKLINVKSQADAIEIFNQLGKLHSARWNAVGLNGAFQDQRFLNFHRSYIKILFQNNKLSMKALTINNQVVGVIYNITYNNTCYFYQIGIDIDNFHHLSLGTILHLSEIKESILHGYEQYDFMKGNKIKSYKQSFTDTTYEMLNLDVHKKGILAHIKNTIRQIIKKLRLLQSGR